MSQNDGSRSRVDRAFPDGKGHRKLNLETPYAATVCSLVGLGLGVSIVSPMVALEYLHTGIETRPFRPEIRFSTYSLLPADRPRSLLTQRFGEMIHEMLAEASKDWQ